MFENPLKSLGKKIDEFLNEIAFEPKPMNKKEKTPDPDPDNIIVKNEILSLFNKSKLNPTQFASLIIMNNVYIENERKGDWTRLQTYEVEEMMNNMKHEIDEPDETQPTPQFVKYKTTIQQKFGIK